MITVIGKLDGTRINLLEQGFITLDFVVSPIDLVFDSESVPGRPGRIRTRSDYGNRKAILKLMCICDSIADTRVKRDLLESILDGAEPYYIYESDTTAMYGFEVPGQTTGNYNFKNVVGAVDYSKRLLLQRVGNESMKFDGLIGKRSIEYETFSSPFWETGGGTP